MEITASYIYTERNYRGVNSAAPHEDALTRRIVQAKSTIFETAVGSAFIVTIDNSTLVLFPRDGSLQNPLECKSLSVSKSYMSP